MTDYALDFSTAVKGQSLPPAKIALNAKGNERQINLDKLTVNARKENRAEGAARLAAGDQLARRADLDGINTAKEVPDWPSKLNGRIKTRAACTAAAGRCRCRS